ncbi:hydroxymethylglutaryl-CoA reductase, degradative [Polyangium sp. y55x31]|uniref:hydroxymethylglutaryl-CoA reductase, degradative n=1 Tax=Polyangium sp. y55x31 TaxID=3042688 RepID=UPI0024829FDF|nr:hydroxymethylglutaryl-CoA reductase, degradative [Polyangium sp. y55x31]MDI1474972.1 hydroxymethylglutaryl-CoA reductase, degradative [Polyangium sp. y55x31]
MNRSITSRLSKFYERSPEARLVVLREMGAVDDVSFAHLARGGSLDVAAADRMSENVIATHALPLGVGLNFVINGRDVLVPMAVEEPSVVAAASNAARMVRASGGFFGEADPPIMTAQIQLDDVPEPTAACARILEARERLSALGDASIPRMVARGGGVRDLDVRVLDEALGVIVLHVHVDVGDCMGANTVDTVAEAMAPAVHEITGGTMGLRILTNLPLRRLVRVRAEVRDEDVGGEELATGIARASRFAELDVFRAVTHNKGFMNGLDAAAIALGQDFRAIEAGAHAFAAHRGQYRPLSTWKRKPGGLVGEAELPLAVGTAGGLSSAHPGVRAALDMLGASNAGELGVVLASVGLASNLAALRALAGEGIQRGHMRLHERKHNVQVTEPPPALNGSRSEVGR